MARATQIKIFAWSLSSLVALIAVIGWGQGIHWQLAHITTYQLFPLLGLLAFSIMWSHYIVSVIRQLAGVDKKEIHLYFEVTSWIVLFAIIMHPGLLEWQLWHDGFGLPPGSVLQNYVAHSLRWAALLGMVSLLIFLTYELRRWFSNKGWWPVVAVLTDIAMVAIFIHSLKLGTQLQHGWLRSVWYFYGVTLAAALIFIYYQKFNHPKKTSPKQKLAS